MDFPKQLGPKFVDGLDEIKQAIDLVLKNTKGSFLQSHVLGSAISLHVSNQFLEQSVKETIEKLNVTVSSIKVKGDEVYLTIEYNFENVILKFTIDD